MILDEIIANKKKEIKGLRADLPKNLPVVQNFLADFSKGKLGLIAEVKKASPSAGLLQENYDPVALAKIYQDSGAAAISVLTDKKYFQGGLEDLKAVKQAVSLPVLRKDFIIDEKQVYESRVAGADAILLIVRVLTDAQLTKLLQLTEGLGLQALVETHNAPEVKRALDAGAKIIGINNRDLDTLKINLEHTVELMRLFPELSERTVISESGIKTKMDIELLQRAGVAGVLIGETLLKSRDVAAQIKELF